MVVAEERRLFKLTRDISVIVLCFYQNLTKRYNVISKTYYGNTLNDWIITIILIILSVLFAKFLYFLIEKILKKITSETETKLHDILLDLLKEPLVFALIILGIWYSLQVLYFVESTLAFINTVYYILIIFDIAWFIVRIFDAMIERYIVPFTKKTETKLDDQLLPILRKGIKASVWILSILIALNNAGYDVGAILASLGIGGLAFALAAKDTVANLFGSLTIFLDEPFEIGDRIIIEGYDGFVEDVGLRSTRLRLLNGRIMTMSNSSMTNSPVENVSSEPNRRITLNIGLTYDTSPQKMQEAIEILEKIIKENDYLNNNSIVAFVEFQDSALIIRIIYHIKKGNCIFTSQSSVNMEILKQFNDVALNFAFPTQTILIEKDN